MKLEKYRLTEEEIKNLFTEYENRGTPEFMDVLRGRFVLHELVSEATLRKVIPLIAEEIKNGLEGYRQKNNDRNLHFIFSPEESQSFFKQYEEEK
uniref:Uncharacterized protein n=1 Tax=viral metagenome TaxID=1070528 RepID=A0A6M3J5A2_9ZZZZ